MHRVASLLRGTLVMGFQLILVVLVIAASQRAAAAREPVMQAPAVVGGHVEVDLDSWSL